MMDKILETVKKLHSLNTATPCDLAGGAYCASFESIDLEAAWLQVKSGALNISYPWEVHPLTLLRTIRKFPIDAGCPDWEPGKYATFEFDPMSAEEISELVDELFRSLYKLPEGAAFDIDIIDMR